MYTSPTHDGANSTSPNTTDGAKGTSITTNDGATCTSTIDASAKCISSNTDGATSTFSISNGVTDTFNNIHVHSAFPFDPGLPQQRLSAILATNQNPDGDIIIDTGAGRGIKPTMSGLTNPTPANSLITWGDGTSAGATIEASLPGHDLPPFLVTPDATCTLVSVGSNVENTTDCYSFFDKHSFRLSGLQVFKDKAGQLDARFVGPKNNRVKYIATKSRSGDVY